MGLGIDAGLDAIHVTAYGEPMVATGITDGHTPHEPGALLRRRGTRAPRARRAGDRDGPPHARGRRAGAGRRRRRRDRDGPPAHRRPRPAQQARAPVERDRIRPCAYQYRCIGAIFLNEPVQCAVNPEAGHEADGRAGRHRRAAPGRGRGRRTRRARVRAPPRRARPPRRAARGQRPARRPARASPRRPTPTSPACSTGWSAAAEDAGVVDPPRHAGRRSRPTPTCWCGPSARRWPGDGRRSASTTSRRGSLDGRAARRSRRRRRQQQGGRVARGPCPRARATTSTLVPDAEVLAPELGLPGRFRLVAAARAAGVVDRRRRPPGAATGGARRSRASRRHRPPHPEVHVIGDAAGTGGLAGARFASRRRRGRGAV